jgi:hypothetical protein
MLTAILVKIMIHIARQIAVDIANMGDGSGAPLLRRPEHGLRPPQLVAP